MPINLTDICYIVHEPQEEASLRDVVLPVQLGALMSGRLGRFRDEDQIRLHPDWDGAIADGWNRLIAHRAMRALRSSPAGAQVAQAARVAIYDTDGECALSADFTAELDKEVADLRRNPRRPNCEDMPF
jgi:hypothetical protein